MATFASIAAFWAGQMLVYTIGSARQWPEGHTAVIMSGGTILALLLTGEA